MFQSQHVQLRIRFHPFSLQRLLELDEIAFKYLFWQVCLNFNISTYIQTEIQKYVDIAITKNNEKYSEQEICLQNLPSEFSYTLGLWLRPFIIDI